MAEATRPYTSLEEVAEVFPNLERVEGVVATFCSDGQRHLAPLDHRQLPVVGFVRNGSPTSTDIFVDASKIGIIAARPHNFMQAQALLVQLGV